MMKIFSTYSLMLASVVAAGMHCSVARHAWSQTKTVDEFRTERLSDVYYSEGANGGDINGDGQADVVCGPYWYEAPSFERKHEIYAPVAQNRDRYADNFFSWIRDFDGDGFGDVLVVGFPGTPAYVYQNPGPEASDAENTHWEKHQVLDWVSNESPQFTDLVGDSGEELVCTRDGFFGFASVNTEDPFGAWTFHAVSEQIAPKKFGHGLGVGDINGDGRNDILFSGGWFEQPESNPESGRWKLHEVSFSKSYGGADMFAYDVDGDGDTDVLTSHAAHDFGLGWYEQIVVDGEMGFRHHLIMGDRPERSAYGLVISELHSVALEDMDGDGLKDLITGKTYWSHHRQSPMWNADPVVYWFRLVRREEGVDWVPYQAGNESGIGRQLSVRDLNNDGLADMIVGGMKGAHVLIHSRRDIDLSDWEQLQPVRYESTGDRSDRGDEAQFNEEGRIDHSIEGESMDIASVSGGTTSIQKMTSFKADRWSGSSQLFWRGATPRSRLDLEFNVAKAGRYEIAVVMTTARDYAMVNLQLNGQALGTTIDLYDYPDVRTTGVIEFGERQLKAGKNRLRLETVGANESAAPSHMVGLDCLLARPVE